MQPYLIVNDMEVSPFDYMKQFWRENEVQMFSAKETQLYFFFLSESNRLYWRNPFGCSTQRITNNLGISRQTLCRFRKKLQDRGLITYEEGKNNSIVPCYGLLIKSKDSIMQNVTINGTQNGTVNVTPCETADGTIIKTHKTADNESIISMEELLPLDRLQTILGDDREWMMRIKEHLGKQGIKLDETNIGKRLEGFFLYLQTGGTKLKSITDTQKHFVNWLMKKECSKGNKQKSLSPQQVGVKLTEDNPNKFKNISEW